MRSALQARWTFYKRESYDEALHEDMALLDYKVSIGTTSIGSTRRGRTPNRRYLRVIGLSFSDLGGPDAVREYSRTYGRRSYEDRVYSILASTTWPSCATTMRRRRTGRSSLFTRPPRRAALQHAGRGHVHSGRIPGWCWKRSGSSRPGTG